jgi:Bacterial regulatory protein, arsR family
MNAEDLYLLVGMSAVSSDGKTSFRDLSKTLGVPVGFIQRHLAVLQRAQLVDGRRRPNLGKRQGAADLGSPLHRAGDARRSRSSGHNAAELSSRCTRRRPDTSQQHPALRELLVLVDALRLDDPRVRGIASEMLSDRLDARAGSARR